MLSEEIAVENAMYIGYASPNKLVKDNPDYVEYMGEDAIDLLYNTLPEDINAPYNERFETTCYKNFTPEIQSRVNTLWENLKIQDSTEPWIHVASVSIVAVVIALAIYSVYVKKKRSHNYRTRDKLAMKAKNKA